MRRTEAARAVVEAPWSSMTKLVAFALLALADKGGVVGMTQSQLALKVGITDRTVRTALAEMGSGPLVVEHDRKCFRLLLEPEPGSGSEASRTGTTFRNGPSPNRNLVPETPPEPEPGSGSTFRKRASRTLSENSSLSEISSSSKTSNSSHSDTVFGEPARESSEKNPAPEAEKNRPSNGKKKTARWRRVPAAWSPSLEHVQMAHDLGVDLKLESEKFRDHEFASPKTDADATFRNWLRAARPGGNGSAGPRKAFNAAQDALDAQMQRIADLEALEALEREAGA